MQEELFERAQLEFNDTRKTQLQLGSLELILKYRALGRSDYAKGFVKYFDQETKSAADHPLQRLIKNSRH